jgi:hypothetical protein
MYQTAVGSETITNIFDFVAAQPTLSTSALVTNRYGLFIDFNNTQVTNAWGIYQSSNTVKNYINGNLLLGSTTDTTEKLQVTGAAKITGTATVGSITLPADGIITSGTTWNTGVLRFFNGPTEYASFDVPNGRFKFNQPNILFEAGVLSYTGTIDNFAYGLKTNNVERVRIKTEGHVRFIPLSAAPTTNVQSGDVYYDSTTNKLRCYNGTSWNDLF